MILFNSGLYQERDSILRPVLFCLVLLLFLTAFTNTIFAADKYPTRPITFVVGYAPGGPTDIAARAIANAASKHLPQPIVVVNKPGGSSAIALTSLKNEKPDGYTLAVLPTGGMIQQHMVKVPYDTDKDFTQIMQYGRWYAGLVVRSDSPWKTIGELIDYARANPGKIRWSTSGPAAPECMVMEQLSTLANVKFKLIPFEGSAPAIAAILGGHVEACAETMTWKAHALSGRLRVLVSFSSKRFPFAPDVPTLKEVGYDTYHPSMAGVIGPKGLPANVVETLHTAFKKALEDPEFLKVVEDAGMVVVYNSPKDMPAAVAELNEKIESLVMKMGLRKE